jgi:hypothetical protein
LEAFFAGLDAVARRVDDDDADDRDVAFTADFVASPLGCAWFRWLS